MFDPDEKNGIYAWMRKAGLEGGQHIYTALVIDIGAFTTDMGCVKFEIRNREIDDVHHPEVLQVSRPIGISLLDDRVLSRLPSAVRQAIKNRSVREWEQYKIRLYAGSDAAVPSPSGDMLTFGGPRDFSKIKAEADSFAGETIKAVKEFCHDNLVTPDQVLITGGGAAIECLRTPVLKGVKREFEIEPPNMLDPNEPFGVLSEKRLPQGGWRFDPKEVSERRQMNLALARGGSALGACSVFVDLPLAYA